MIESEKTWRATVTWRRSDVDEVVKDAESEARRTKRPQYVGATGWPDGSQIHDEATPGYTDDKPMLERLGRLFVTCEPHETAWHA
jgi:hypothetical protein